MRSGLIKWECFFFCSSEVDPRFQKRLDAGEAGSDFGDHLDAGGGREHYGEREGDGAGEGDRDGSVQIVDHPGILAGESLGESGGQGFIGSVPESGGRAGAQKPAVVGVDGSGGTRDVQKRADGVEAGARGGNRIAGGGKTLQNQVLKVGDLGENGTGQGHEPGLLSVVRGEQGGIVGQIHHVDIFLVL